MQDRPTASELLTAVAAVLKDEVLPVLEGGLQHKVRVAANVCAIIERELRLGPDADRREQEALHTLLGSEGTLAELNAELASRLRRGDAMFLARCVEVLMEATVLKLAVNKPGYTLEADR